MPLNLSKPILGLDGNPIPSGSSMELTLGRLLANALFNSTEGDALKFHCWAVELHKTGQINPDKSDIKTLRDFVVAQKGMPVWGKAPLLEAIDEAKVT